MLEVRVRMLEVLPLFLWPLPTLFPQIKRAIDSLTYDRGQRCRIRRKSLRIRKLLRRMYSGTRLQARRRDRRDRLWKRLRSHRGLDLRTQRLICGIHKGSQTAEFL